MPYSSVTIQQGSPPAGEEFSDTLREILVADIGNGCSTPADHTAEAVFRNLGMAVASIAARKEYLLELPKGNCEPMAGRAG